MVEVMLKIAGIVVISMLILQMMFIIIPMSVTAEYVQHEPIKIDSDVDFFSYASSGNGTQENPWIIENLKINGTGYESCIYVGNTTENFTIKNCHLSNSNFFGIYFNKVNCGNIINNNISFNNVTGILLSETSNINVLNNSIFSNGGSGIRFLDSKNIIISNNCVAFNDGAGIGAVENRYPHHENIIHNNTISNNNNSGISIMNSYEQIITNNTINNNNKSGGIYLGGCPYSKIMNNTISNHTVGMYIIGSDNAVISNNTFISNSLYDIDSNVNTNLTISGNEFEIGISIDDEEPYIPGNEVENNADEMPSFGFELIFLATIIGIIIVKKRKLIQ